MGMMPVLTPSAPASVLPGSPVATPGAAFIELRRRVLQTDLFHGQPVYYVLQIIWCAALLATGATLITLSDSLLVQLPNAALMAFASGQIGLLGHDAGHCQLFRRQRWNMVLGQLCALCTGVSRLYWVEKHNEHHALPNHEDMDPDIDYVVMAFTADQAQKKSGLLRWIVRHQTARFFPIIALSAYSLRDWSIRYFLHHPLRKTRVDLLCFSASFVLYFGWIFSHLPPVTGVLFILAHQALWGMYLGSVFAPNHKGMPVIRRGQEIGYLQQQVMTSRNVRGNPVVDLVYGGLNYQIEHHLFPTMPRRNLRRVRLLVRDYCREADVPYHETGVVQSFREIFAHLRAVSLQV